MSKQTQIVSEVSKSHKRERFSEDVAPFLWLFCVFYIVVMIVSFYKDDFINWLDRKLLSISNYFYEKRQRNSPNLYVIEDI